MIDWILKVEKEPRNRHMERATIIYGPGERNYTYLNLGFTSRMI